MENKVNPVMRHISFGSGEKTMVIVPGLSIGYVTDNPQAIEDAFSAFTKDYTVHLFDVRDDVPEDYTIRSMGEDLAAEIRALGLAHVHLYGCSMGGMESIYLASHYPELVEKLAVASSACEMNATASAVLGSWIRLAKAGAYHELTDDMGKRIYSQPVYEASRQVFSAMADALTQESVDRFIRIAGAIPGMDLSAEAAQIRCPVLVLGSRGDRVLTVQGPCRIAEITGGELYLYDEAHSHAVYDEAPDLRVRVKAFFDR